MVSGCSAGRRQKRQIDRDEDGGGGGGGAEEEEEVVVCVVVVAMAVAFGVVTAVAADVREGDGGRLRLP